MKDLKNYKALLHSKVVDTDTDDGYCDVYLIVSFESKSETSAVYLLRGLAGDYEVESLYEVTEDSTK